MLILAGASEGIASPFRSRGSVLFLFPTALFVVFVLGALALDVGAVALRARELEDAAATAAADALAALDVDALRSGEGVRIDEAAARAHVAASVAAGPLPDATVEEVAVTVDPQGRAVIGVTLRLHVDLLLAPAVGPLRDVVLVRTEFATILGSEVP